MWTVRRFCPELVGRAPAVVVVAALLVALGSTRTAVAGEPAWAWPLPPPVQVARPFDPPQHRYAAGHRGADLVGSPGSTVLAAGAGHVSYAGLLAGRGVVVVVHGDLRTTYEPVTADVVPGQPVEAGTPIGRLEPGHAGCPAAACLHWGLRRGETYLDPLQLVDPGPARLLPVGPAADVPVGPGAADGPAAAETVPAPAPAPRGTSRALGAAPPRVAEPHWSLRAAEAPVGAAAVLALVAGLTLLLHPRRPPDGPAAAGGAGAQPSDTAPPGLEPTLAAPVDLSAERLRRRTAS